MQRVKFVLSHFAAALAALLGREEPLRLIWRDTKRVRMRQLRPGDKFYAEFDSFDDVGGYTQYGAGAYFVATSWPSFTPLGRSWGINVEEV